MVLYRTVFEILTPKVWKVFIESPDIVQEYAFTDLHHCPECHFRHYSPRHFHSHFHTIKGMCKPSCVSCMNTSGLWNVLLKGTNRRRQRTAFCQMFAKQMPP